MLQQLAEQPQKALAICVGQLHPQLDEFAVPYRRWGRTWVAIRFLLFRGLRPELFHDGDELQQSGQANNRI